MSNSKYTAEYFDTIDKRRADPDYEPPRQEPPLSTEAPVHKTARTARTELAYVVLAFFAIIGFLTILGVILNPH